MRLYIKQISYFRLNYFLCIYTWKQNFMYSLLNAPKMSNLYRLKALEICT